MFLSTISTKRLGAQNYTTHTSTTNTCYKHMLTHIIFFNFNKLRRTKTNLGIHHLLFFKPVDRWLSVVLLRHYQRKKPGVAHKKPEPNSGFFQHTNCRSDLRRRFRQQLVQHNRQYRRQRDTAQGKLADTDLHPTDTKHQRQRHNHQVTGF